MAEVATSTPPKAGLRDLFSYLSEHRAVLAIVLVISLVGAALNLAQPVMVNRLITAWVRAATSAAQC